MVYDTNMIQKLLDIADERMRVVILLASSWVLGLVLSLGCPLAHVEEFKDLFKITIYENEPEEYTVFCTSEARKAIDLSYLDMRRAMVKSSQMHHPWFGSNSTGATNLQ